MTKSLFRKTETMRESQAVKLNRTSKMMYNLSSKFCYMTQLELKSL